MLDFDSFLSGPRSCLIAPAGYGKTYTIVECLRRTSGRQLILTHTHAGVASLREKLHAARIPSAKYELSTISAIAQQLSICFTTKERTLSQDQRGYFEWCIQRATALLRVSAIKKIFETTYAGVFVDEYQDCTISQHNLLMLLAEHLPMRVLGDPMQGIFGFNEPLVNFDRDLSEFSRQSLDEPQRWKRTNPQLGLEIAAIRHCLETGAQIYENTFHAIQFKRIQDSELQHSLMELCYALPRGETALVLTSKSVRNARCGIAKLFGGRCSIVEAIDDKEFYTFAKLADGVCAANCMRVLYELASSLFFKTHIDKWLNFNGAVRKKSDEDRKIAEPLSEAVERLREHPTAIALLDCIEALLHMHEVCLLSHEKCFSLLSSIRAASADGGTVLDAMKAVRNTVRGMGRHVRPFSVGSTLLTKGLEFDHVIVCDYDPGFDLTLDDKRKNFYVAISRACKSLCVIRRA